MPNTSGQESGKFVERFEMAIMQYAILEKARQQGGVTRENLEQTFQGEMKMEYSHLDHCLQQLTREEHLKQEGNKFTATDDGREDVQKVQHLVMGVQSVVRSGASATQQGGGKPQSR